MHETRAGSRGAGEALSPSGGHLRVVVSGV